MHVEVRLYGEFRRLLREQNGRLRLEVVEGTTVRDVLARVQVPEAEVGLVSVNGALAPVETPLREGDALDVFPPIGGGCVPRHRTPLDADRACGDGGASAPLNRRPVAEP